MLTPSPFLTRTQFPTRTPILTATSTMMAATPIPVWGMAMEQILPGSAFDQVEQAGLYWLRSATPISWASVEPTEGARDWGKLSQIDGELSAIMNMGMQTILSVRVTPEWAQNVPGYSCGAIKPEKLAAFGSFMHDVVDRYSAPLYHVKYWEIWNEPDIDPSVGSPDSPYGCWGDSSDPYYGGGYYADMLKVVYPQIKAADPQAHVLIGGLLLDCDPRPDAGCEITGHDPKPAMFLEGILRNGGGSFFDGVSFHSYDYYQGQGKFYANPNWQSAWNTTGPVVIEKVRFVNSFLNAYGLSGKFIIDTENALICTWDGCATTEFETIKAYYLAETYAAAIAQGLRGNLWYSWLGWNNSGLINTGSDSLPGYLAFQFSRNELFDSVWVRDITQYSGVKGYEFNRGDRRVWILWSMDATSHPISLTNAPLAIWDALGVSISTANSVNITVKPLYLEWKP